MKVEIVDYKIGTQSGDALILVYGADDCSFDSIIFDGTVNFEFKTVNYENKLKQYFKNGN